MFHCNKMEIKFVFPLCIFTLISECLAEKDVLEQGYIIRSREDK